MAHRRLDWKVALAGRGGRLARTAADPARSPGQGALCGGARGFRLALAGRWRAGSWPSPMSADSPCRRLRLGGSEPGCATCAVGPGQALGRVGGARADRRPGQQARDRAQAGACSPLPGGVDAHFALRSLGAAVLAMRAAARGGSSTSPAGRVQPASTPDGDSSLVGFSRACTRVKTGRIVILSSAGGMQRENASEDPRRVRLVRDGVALARGWRRCGGTGDRRAAAGKAGSSRRPAKTAARVQVARPHLGGAGVGVSPEATEQRSRAIDRGARDRGGTGAGASGDGQRDRAAGPRRNRARSRWLTQTRFLDATSAVGLPLGRSALFVRSPPSWSHRSIPPHRAELSVRREAGGSRPSSRCWLLQRSTSHWGSCSSPGGCSPSIRTSPGSSSPTDSADGAPTPTRCTSSRRLGPQRCCISSRSGSVAVVAVFFVARRSSGVAAQLALAMVTLAHRSSSRGDARARSPVLVVNVVARRVVSRRGDSAGARHPAGALLGRRRLPLKSGIAGVALAGLVQRGAGRRRSSVSPARGSPSSAHPLPPSSW